MGGMAYHVVATLKNGSVRLVMVNRRGSFTVRPALAKHRSGGMCRTRAHKAKAWAERKGWKVRLCSPGHLPFITRENGVIWPGDKILLHKLNELGRRRKAYVHVISGFRTPRKAWELRIAYLEGRGNVAARCCTKYDWEIHSWDACGKDPQSNHAIDGGHAVDCGIIQKDGSYVSIGDDPKARKLMHKLGLCLPVGPATGSPQKEPWHVQVGDTWAA